LSADVDDDHDHIRGPEDAPVTLVEYGDFECPYCGQAESVIRELLVSFGDDLRYVWRHLPLNDVHTNAQMAAEASEAASAQGSFWELYELLLSHQDELAPGDLGRYAQELDLDVGRFVAELRRHEYAPRVAEDVTSADASGVSGTPTFFINGRRHYGPYDIPTLTTPAPSAPATAHARRRPGGGAGARGGGRPPARRRRRELTGIASPSARSATRSAEPLDELRAQPIEGCDDHVRQVQRLRGGRELVVW